MAQQVAGANFHCCGSRCESAVVQRFTLDSFRFFIPKQNPAGKFQRGFALKIVG
jgi:hypothetical protein